MENRWFSAGFRFPESSRTGRPRPHPPPAFPSVPRSPPGWGGAPCKDFFACSSFVFNWLEKSSCEQGARPECCGVLFQWFRLVARSEKDSPLGRRCHSRLVRAHVGIRKSARIDGRDSHKNHAKQTRRPLPSKPLKMHPFRPNVSSDLFPTKGSSSHAG